MRASLISNPPYNMTWTPPPLAGFMPKFQGLPIPTNANFAFVLTGLSLIDDKAVFILPMSVLQPKKEEKEILRLLIENNLIGGVVVCPERMFESTSIGVCLLLLEKERKTRRFALVDLREFAEQETRDQRGQYGGSAHTKRTYHKELNVLSAEVMQRAAKAIRELTDEEFSVVVTPEVVAEHDYSLTPSQYKTKPVVLEYRSFKDIGADYNRIVDSKNEIQITMNETAAKRLGLDCLKWGNDVDVSKSFAVAGVEAKKGKYFSTTKSDGITIRCSTKDGIPILIQDFLSGWSQRLRFLNVEENRLLAEFRDALLPALMNGEIEIE